VKKTDDSDSEIVYLLKYLLAIELYRSGLTQAEVRVRLKLNNNVLSEMLRGLPQPKTED
jgi:hypothetical protein